MAAEMPDVPCPHCGALNKFTNKSCVSCNGAMSPEAEERSGAASGVLTRLLSKLPGRR